MSTAEKPNTQLVNNQLLLTPGVSGPVFDLDAGPVFDLPDSAVLEDYTVPADPFKPTDIPDAGAPRPQATFKRAGEAKTTRTFRPMGSRSKPAADSRASGPTPTPEPEATPA